ncbi:hypothetical protein SLE2022_022340 [Rubroshorea leprosula]
MATSEKRAVGEAESWDAGVRSPQKEKSKIDDSSTLVKDKPQHDYDSDDSYDSDDYLRLIHQKRDSDGFDVDSVPHGVLGAFCIYNDLSQLKDDLRQRCDDFANKAVEFHNLNKSPENANLEFVKMLKVNFEYMPPGGETYFLTFEAKDVKSGIIDSYQGKVLGAYSNQIGQLIPNVLMFRKRGDTCYLGQDPKLYKKWTDDSGGGEPRNC